MVRIEKWSVISSGSSEDTKAQPRWLHGYVYGHPKFDDGHEVATSVIIGGSVKTDAGHVVKTKSRDYLLGAPSQRYLEWLEQHGIAFDNEQPIKSVE